jgi:hypothetical protein
MSKRKYLVNPAVKEINRNYRESARQIKADHDLRMHGTKIHGGYALTEGQLADYFKDVDKRRSHRKRRK